MDWQTDILLVAVIAGIIYLLKIGAISAAIAALGKLWKRLSKKDDE